MEGENFLLKYYVYLDTHVYSNDKITIFMVMNEQLKLYCGLNIK